MNIKTYIGTKIVKAFQAESKAGDITEDGYAVEYDDGYTSWSPKYVFERHYREMTHSERTMLLEVVDPRDVEINEVKK